MIMLKFNLVLMFLYYNYIIKIKRINVKLNRKELKLIFDMHGEIMEIK